jgi:hypothetical protein
MTGVTDQAVGEQSTAGQVKDTMQEGMQGAKERVQETAQQARGQMSQQLRSQVDQRSTQAGEQAYSWAQTMRSTAEQLRGQGQDAPARFADSTAQRVERVGTYLRDSNADRILDDVEDFARRQPWLIAIAGAVAGFMGSRLLKASSTTRYESRVGGPSGYLATTPYVPPTAGYVPPTDPELPLSTGSDLYAAPGAELGSTAADARIGRTDADIVT